MSVSVSMPQLGESVTEGTVTRWLKREGERVEADEPLLEVSTDKVDTEIPSPVSGILRGITVAEDETVAVGAELAVIDEEGAAGGPAPAAESSAPAAESSAPAAAAAAPTDGSQGYDGSPYQQPYQAPAAQPPGREAPAAAYQPQAAAPPAAAPPVAPPPVPQAPVPQAPGRSRRRRSRRRPPSPPSPRSPTARSRAPWRRTRWRQPTAPTPG